MQVLALHDKTLGDDGSEGSDLTAAYQPTKDVWEEMYRGEVYDIRGSGYIHPGVRHPVAKQMGMAEKFFGLPMTHRTGGQQHTPQHQARLTPLSPSMHVRVWAARGVYGTCVVCRPPTKVDSIQQIQAGVCLPSLCDRYWTAISSGADYGARTAPGRLPVDADMIAHVETTQDVGKLVVWLA
jgi:hypothetical protein